MTEIDAQTIHYLTSGSAWEIYPGAIAQIEAAERRRAVWWRRLCRWIGRFGE